MTDPQPAHAQPFMLVRGGTVIADGTRFPDGICVTRRRNTTELAATATHATLTAAVAAHRNDRASLVWVDPNVAYAQMAAAVRKANAAAVQLRDAFRVALNHAGGRNRPRPAGSTR